MSASVCNRVRFRVPPLAIAACLLAAPLQADPPASVTYSYDELGRLRTGTFGDGRVADYQYDAAGNRTSMTSGFPVRLAIGAASNVSEGGNLVFPVTKTGTSTNNVTVSCVPQNGTAQSSPGASPPFDDYVTTAQTITFLPSDPSPTTKNCTIATKTDSYYEGTQTVTASLQNSVAAVITPPGTASGSILDASSPPSMTIAGSSATEGSAVGFTITRNGLTEHAHSVTYSTANGSATTADGDYTAVSATANVTATSTTASSVNVSVATSTDTKFEINETFTVSLSAPGNQATLGSPASATGTINNDDPTPIVRINNPEPVNEGQQRTFTVELIGNLSTPYEHSISWATQNGTASAGTDYVAASGTVSLNAVERWESITVQTLNDGVFESTTPETFSVVLSTNANSNGAQISPTEGVGTGVIGDLQQPAPNTPSMTSPNFRQDTDGSYGVDWTDATGPVAYYLLDEDINGSGGFGSYNTYNVTASFKSFSGKGSGEYYYRVRACNAGGSCSGYSSVIFVLVCVGGCNFADPAPSIGPGADE